MRLSVSGGGSVNFNGGEVEVDQEIPVMVKSSCRSITVYPTSLFQYRTIFDIIVLDLGSEFTTYSFVALSDSWTDLELSGVLYGFHTLP